MQVRSVHTTKRRVSPPSPPQRLAASSLVKRLGRGILWATLLLLLVRGTGSVLADPPKPPPPPAPNAAASWPDDEARAFAVRFARAYLALQPNPDEYAASLRPFVAPELSESVVPQVPDRGRVATIGEAAVARIARVSDGHALVTVAASMGTATRFLAVPVARDQSGGLVVDGLPSFAPAPPAGHVDVETRDSVTGLNGEQITDLLTRFFRAYLTGDAAGLTYMLVPGVRVGASAQPLSLVSVDSVGAAGPANDSRWVVAQVRAKDTGGVVYDLAYRVLVVKRDRWYVQAVNTTEGTP